MVADVISHIRVEQGGQLCTSGERMSDSRTGSGSIVNVVHHFNSVGKGFGNYDTVAVAQPRKHSDGVRESSDGSLGASSEGRFERVLTNQKHWLRASRGNFPADGLTASPISPIVRTNSKRANKTSLGNWVQ
jgi:hypothetical protein